jgi:hypothetical protein
MIPVFIPMPLGRSISEGRGFTKALLANGIDGKDIHICRAPGEDNPNKGKTALALQGERASRELCQAEAAKLSPQPEYVIMCDPDRNCIDSNNDYAVITGNVADARNFLDIHKDFGAVSLVHPTTNADDEIPHIDIGWAMYRYDIFLILKFKLKEGETCYCPAVTRQIRKLGFRFGYLDEKHRVTPI